MTQAHSWSSLAGEFASDGQFRYIEVENVTASDWQSVLNLLRDRGDVISFKVDGIATPMPIAASRLIESLAVSAVEARVRIEGIIYDWRIETPTMLSFSLHSTVRSAPEFTAMCRFVELLNLATGKSVEINLEGFSPIAKFAGPSEGFAWFVGGGASAH